MEKVALRQFFSSITSDFLYHYHSTNAPCSVCTRQELLSFCVHVLLVSGDRLTPLSIQLLTWQNYSLPTPAASICISGIIIRLRPSLPP
jgi:hypothetical protein